MMGVFDAILALFNNHPTYKQCYKAIMDGIKMAYTGYKFLFFIGSLIFVIFLFIVYFSQLYLINSMYLKPNISILVINLIALFSLIIYYFYGRVFNSTKDQKFDHYYFLQTLSCLKLCYFIYYYSKKDLTIKDYLQQKKLIKSIHFNQNKNSINPNIYFIAIESYGAIFKDLLAQDNDDFLQQIKAELQENSWQIRTNLSYSPINGGLSWLAYGSFFHGFSFENTWLYQEVLMNCKKYQPESVFHILAKLGYRSCQIVPTTGFENFKVPWSQIKEFYGFNDIYTFDNLDYKGYLIKNFGYSPPDQYTLFKSKELIKHQNSPLAYFLITQNSHYPFNSPQNFFKLWQQCSTASKDDYNMFENLSPSKNLNQKYLNAIKYQLKTITQFINNADANSLFILFGDHQPPFISNPNTPKLTPIHIISQNKKYIESWEKYHFKDGFHIFNTNQEHFIQHQDFKNFFIESIELLY